LPLSGSSLFSFSLLPGVVSCRLGDCKVLVPRESLLCKLEDERNSERTRVVRVVLTEGKIVVRQTSSSRVEVKHAATGPKRTQSFFTEIYSINL
jgi:hypothetical protein